MISIGVQKALPLHQLMIEQTGGEYPLPPAASCALCKEAGYGTLPDYFRLVTGKITTLPREM